VAVGGTTWLFLRLLGLTYLIAFLSLALQIDGLIGPSGLLPARQWLEAVSVRLGPERYWLLPTVFWLGAGEAALRAAAVSGIVLSLLLLAGVLPLPSLALLWALYLSFASVAQVFLGYQWDSLLLEAGFLALFLAPPRLLPRPGPESEPAPLALWLLRFLLFRLMLSSGLVKLASGDPSWRQLTALRVHYETQPLPTWIGWYAHQLPPWFHTLSAALLFVLELLVPILVLCPRRLRVGGACALGALQLLIAATGNYGFFNLLTAILCVLALDDAAWPERLRARLARFRARPPQPCPLFTLAPVAALVVLVSGAQMARGTGIDLPLPSPLRALFRAVAPFRTINPYGLFAVMTTTRPEIVVEGSADGLNWRAYEFPWKPGTVTRAPAFVAPHQPRLDWQMWFAALGTCEENPWFVRFLAALLEGSPSVLGLLETNPFPGKPPRYVRAVLYDYRFSDLALRRRTGAWWTREERGLYCPVLSREE
jgi:hypothetical protein